MAINVEEFKNRLKYGGARNNLFKVFVRPPAVIPGAAASDIPFFCKAAQLPGVTQAVVEVPYQGRIIKVYGNRTYEDWTITLYNDESPGVQSARDMFLQWSNRMNGFESNVSNGVIDAPPASYKTSATIQQISKDGSVLREYGLVGVWPSSVGAIDMSWDQSTNIQEFTVTISYDYWVPSQTAAPGVGTAVLERDFIEVTPG
jgi:hypothetical protein